MKATTRDIWESIKFALSIDTTVTEKDKKRAQKKRRKQRKKKGKTKKEQMGRWKNTKLVLLSIVYTIGKAIRRGPLFPPVDALPSSISTPVFSLFFRWRSATMRKPARVIRTGHPRESLFQRSWAMLMHRPRRIIIKCGRSEIWWWWLSAADSTVFSNLIGKW